MALQEGIKAPLFKASTQSNTSIKLSSYKGKTVVLYFYPKDNTTGCTAQACDFRDSMQRLTALDVVVLGVSPDSPKSHTSFIENHALNFDLISDEDKHICELYDVWKEKSMYGRKYMGVERTTYIINGKGKIVKTFEKVKVPGHVEQVLDFIQSM